MYRTLVLTCNYCGHAWKKQTWATALSLEDNEECPSCKDSSIKISEETKGDVFGYNYKPKVIKKGRAV